MILWCFRQDGLTGSAWGDWANYTASPLRAFENELGVQAPTGFWDPAGFTADGSVENFKRRRQTELKHGRISMLATMGYITPETCSALEVLFDLLCRNWFYILMMNDDVNIMVRCICTHILISIYSYFYSNACILVRTRTMCLLYINIYMWILLIMLLFIGLGMERICCNHSAVLTLSS